MNAPQPKTALVLAAPERKRILRELLARPEPWPIADRNLYREMIQAEYWDMAPSTGADNARESVEKNVFAALVQDGIPVPQAIEVAQEQAHLFLQTPTEGQRERASRRMFREAVTASDGALAATIRLVHHCIVCGGSLFMKNRRTDSAYCSNACRQAAYRRRHSTSSMKARKDTHESDKR